MPFEPADLSCLYGGVSMLFLYLRRYLGQRGSFFVCASYCSSTVAQKRAKPPPPSCVNVLGREYRPDKAFNIRPFILSLIGRNLLSVRGSPLHLLKLRIKQFFDDSYVDSRNQPLFRFVENADPVVTVRQNFDHLLIPEDHPCRASSDTYYINGEYLLRTHTTAHQRDVIASGCDHFLIAGDVYRRDQIDRTHFPCFHQLDGVFLTHISELERLQRIQERVQLYSKDPLPVERPAKQECHSDLCCTILQQHLRHCLEELVRHLFGNDIKFRWTISTFPFTYPSWEIEIFCNSSWLEILGAGIVQQQILVNAGFPDKVGWAFGIGLERLAMVLYGIPDIRLFWSTDTGFLSQFSGLDFRQPYTYKAVSKYPQCINDLSFWIPTESESEYHINDFYDLVRSVGGDMVEQVHVFDQFRHPRTGRLSHCYRIVYRHMERTLTKKEANEIHQLIEKAATTQLGVVIR